MQRLSKFIYHNVLGWKVVGNIDFSKDKIKKAVIIAAPHTSWHDFYIGVLLRSVLNIKTNFVGKKELFVFPLGCFFRALGGAPIDRHTKENKVEAIAKLFKDKDEFRRYAKKVKTTKNGAMHESDAVLFNRLLDFYIKNSGQERNDLIPQTYPNKIVLDNNLQDSNRVESTEQ